MELTRSIAGSQAAADQRTARLRGLPLALARLGCIVLAASSLVLFVAGLPVQLSWLHDRLRPIAATVHRVPGGELTLSPWSPGPVVAAGILGGDVLVAVDGVALPVEPGSPVPPDLFRRPLGAEMHLLVRTGDAAPRAVTLIAGGPALRPLASLGLSPSAPVLFALAVEIVAALAFTAVATLIAWRRSDTVIALLSASMLLVVFVGALSGPAQAINDLIPLWRPQIERWYGVGFVGIMAFLFLFPDGRFVPRGTALALGLLMAWMLAATATPVLLPWRMPRAPYLTLMALCLAAGVLAQAYRFRRRSGPVERQQTRWVVVGAGLAAVGLALHLGALQFLAGTEYSANLLYLGVVYPGVRLLEAALPLAIAAAILQYQLWAIDVVVRRVLVYGALTACVVTGYALLLTGLSVVIQTQGGALVALLAATLVAIAFEPLQAYFQRAARRLLYGERDEPYAALLRLGASLEATPAPGTAPARIVATVAQSLKLPYVAVQLGYGEVRQEVAAQGAVPAPGLEQTIPLTHQGEIIGRLVVAPRRGEQALSAADRRLLDELARQAGATLHAQALTDELQQAREGLVLAREEERRRIRRDLHDGLGPTLAAQTLKAGAVRHLVRANPELAEQVLGGLEADLT
ncbi:MAG: hypothetical protein HGA45_28965, partial [Chloroflexales bacterium]|nr:hypothetical protein [Chloroflexales bacterium]